MSYFKAGRIVMSAVVVAYFGAQIDVGPRGGQSYTILDCGTRSWKKWPKQIIKTRCRSSDAPAAITDLHGF